ncbi:MAG: HEPN domain-containing protein [Armatimonadota bacterium]
MPDEATREETLRWLTYAAGDLAAAQSGIAKAAILPRHACFFAQQAAEKAIKSAFIWLGIPIIKTHDIVLLQRRLPSGWRLHLLTDKDLNALSEWAIDARYPGEETDPSEHDALAMLNIAQRVLAAVEADLAAAGFSRP